MSTASGTKSKLRETLKQEDAALAQRSRTVGPARAVAKAGAVAAAAVPVGSPAGTPVATEVIAPVLPPPRPAAPRNPAQPKTASSAAAARSATVRAGAAPAEAGKPAEKAAEKPADADRKDKHEKVERDSFSMPASEHKRIKALRDALAQAGCEASKSEVLRAGVALLASRGLGEIINLVGELPKVPKGKRGKKR